MIRLLLYKMMGAIYLKSTEYYLCDRTELPHILSNTLFNHLSSPNCSLMNHAICDKHTLRSLRKACMGRTHNSHNVIASLASVILSTHPWSALSVFILLRRALLVSLSLTQRVLISGKDDKLPRKRGVAGTVGSGGGGMIFNNNVTGWSGGIRITAPVGQTAIWLAVDTIHDAVTHLGLSPLYPLPLFPPSSWSVPTTCCTSPWLLCTHCMSIPVYQHSASCSSCTGCTWPHVQLIQTPLVWVDHPPFWWHQHCCSLWTGESAEHMDPY